MLFKNIFAFSILALQAGFSGAKPIAGHERREAAIAERGPKLLPRNDYVTESGTITGSAGDTLMTYGLSTCAGLAATGTAGPAGTNKVLAHVQCIPDDGSTFRDQAQAFADAVVISGMTDLKIVVYILDPSVVAPPAKPVQNDINNAAIAAASSLGSYYVQMRSSFADPAPAGELMANLDGSITAGGVVY